jgi:carbon monoxide dehydrogenase subunit G
VLVTHSDKIALNASPQVVWLLLRDTPRLARLLPGVESVTPVDNAERETYTAIVNEKVGPFKVTLHLEMELSEIVEQSRIKAAVKGADQLKLSRATGSVVVVLLEQEGRTVAELRIDVEVLGKLATLGATVIRRRMTELFNQFSTSLQAEFGALSV